MPTMIRSLAEAENLMPPGELRHLAEGKKRVVRPALVQEEKALDLARMLPQRPRARSRRIMINFFMWRLALEKNGDLCAFNPGRIGGATVSGGLFARFASGIEFR